MSIRSNVIVKSRLTQSKYRDLNETFKRELKNTLFPRNIRLGYYIKNIDDNGDIAVIFYLTKKQRAFTDENTLTNNSIGYIQTYVNKNENNIHINWLSIQPEHKRNGYATRLIYITALYADSLKITKITLDDSTGNANTKSNIYIKCGFQYSNDLDFSEMTGITKDILGNTKDILRKKF